MVKMEENNMNYTEFKNFVAENIKQYLPEDFAEAEVSVMNMVKPNTTISALSVRKSDSNISPNVYLEYFFEKYEKNVGLAEVMKEIASVVVDKYPQENFEINNLFEKENVLRTVLPKLIPLKTSENYLKDKIYTEFLDMAVIYLVPVSVHSADGFGFVALTKSHFERIGVTKEELFEASKKNISDDFEFTSMIEMLMQMGAPAEVYDDECPMFVLTNKNRINGAAQLLNDKAMTTVAERLGDTFVIIPSSIHEVIALPYDENTNVDDLTGMICAVNGSELPPAEVLSDHPYIFRNGKLEVA
jgi:hypothetical protein